MQLKIHKYIKNPNLSRTFVYVEGKSDVYLLKTLFQKYTDFINIVTYDNPNGILLKSSALAYHSFVDFLLILEDANSLANDYVYKRLETYQNFGYKISETRQLGFFVPEMEIVFCKEQTILEKIVGERISDVDCVKAQYEPKKTLMRLLRLDNADTLVEICLSRLDENDFEFMRNNIEPLTQVKEFLEYANSSDK